jgi:programmed cell death 6-interacting protein
VKRKYDECEDKLKTLTRLEAEVTKLRTSLNNVTSFKSQLRKIEKNWEKVKKDDTNNAILVETARLDREFPGTQLAPASFEDFSKQRPARYNPDVGGVRTKALKQDRLIEQLEAANKAIDAAKDTSLRELQLQYENVYFKYKETESDLVHSKEFYNSLSKIAVHFRDVCNEYSNIISRQSP